jgi:site-specific DNA-methyltransferase (adenine-specific)
VRALSVVPYYQDDFATIYCGDAAEVLPALPQVMTALVTDPPFGLGKVYNGSREEADSPQAYAEWLLPIISLALERLVAGGFAAIWQAQPYMRYLWDWFGDDIHIYCAAKNFVQIRKSLPFTFAYDPVVMFYKAGDPLRRPASPQRNMDYYVADTRPRPSTNKAPERGHPFARPIDAVKHVIANFVASGGVILDPFMGSGTTLRAAKDLGHRAIGIEIEERYCEIAAQRLNQEVLSLGA